MENSRTNKQLISAQTTMGGRIRQARTAQGLTSRQLATHLGVRNTTIKSWEHDRSEPLSNKLLTLAGILNVSVVWLLQGGRATRTRRRSRACSAAIKILQKLESATAMQRNLASLFGGAIADAKRLQMELDEEKNLAAKYRKAVDGPSEPTEGH